MEKKYEKEYHQIENNYWWFCARRHIIIQTIKKFNLNLDSKILEIGCSGGPLIQELKNIGFKNVHGIDISSDAISICNKKGISNVQIMDATQTSFNNHEFDLIIASDILEHIQDETKALEEWNRILAISGILILFVPAYAFLWSNHDEVNLHFRRYYRKKLTKKIASFDLKILKSSYWNFTLFIPAFFIRIIFKGRKSTGDLNKLNKYINNCLIALLKFENNFLLRCNYPFGISVFVVSQKTTS
jgi:2-polyprenyl-3-methyl-5-hydroxy-6-metoxy-1,4-benzoquinol methylase